MKDIINLNGQWNLSDGEKQINATVPGDITNDFFAAGEIADPYFGFNHHGCYDFCRRDYTYRKTFLWNGKEDFSVRMAELVFKGVDLFSEVYFNGVLLGKTENMFKEYRFDISSLIKNGENEVEVRMKSTVTAMENLDCKDYFGVFNVPRVLLRKKQCDFGWDWASNIPGYGIWQDVFVEFSEREKIKSVFCNAGDDKKALFIVELNYAYRSYFDNDANFIEVINPHEDILSVKLALKAGDDADDFMEKTIKVERGKHIVCFDCPNASLWWPNGYGEQPLYKYEVRLIRDGKVVSEKSGHTAFRSVELRQRPTSDFAAGYTIYVNGKAVFVKGSNWVPVDCFTGTVSNEKYFKLISLAKAANYNMLRVWGGGIYEKDIFYDICDRLGIMVWQDFMFACADIPDDDPKWLQNTLEECEYQIIRLRNHPSLVYWCGGNEKTGSFGTLIKRGDNFVDYTLRGMVGHLDGSRPYARQSPCSLTDLANDKSSGESHSSCFEPAILHGATAYRKLVSESSASFISENASMGPVTRQSFERFFPKDKLWEMNDMWQDRMLTNPYAAIKIMFCDAEKKFATELYGAPESLDAFIARGMTAHAEMMKCEIEFYRSNKRTTSGYMNWMYSDMWPTATWAVVDYYLEPKQAYYQMKRSYAPFIMTFSTLDDGKTYFVGINDGLESVEADFVYGVKRLSGEVLWQKSGSATISPEEPFKLEIDCPIETENAYAFVRYTAGGETKTNLFSLDFWKTCKFESDYSTEVKSSGKKAVVTVKANKFAKSLLLSFPDNYKYRYSDNYLDIEAGEERRIFVESEVDIDPEKLTTCDITVK